jgi:predicted ATP-dependent endonuclease of OLD family
MSIQWSSFITKEIMRKEASHITRFELKGYKSIKDLSGEFYEGLNIIIGNNGSGKSNLLFFLYKLLQHDYRELEVFSADVSMFDGNHGPYKRTVKGYIKNKIDVTGSDIQLEESGSEEMPYSELITFEVPKKLVMLSDEFNPRYNLADRRFTGGIEDGYHILILDFWLRYEVNMIHFSAIKDFEKLTEDELYHIFQNSFEKTHSNLKEQVLRYTPLEDIRLSNSLRMAKIDSSIYEIRNLVFEYKLNGNWFSWNGLSDGTKRLLYVLFSISDIRIAVDVNDEYEITPIVFFEEPELGIHPHQLHLLMTLLKERAEKQQIIISTHSPQVLDVLGADDLHRIFITEIEPEKGTILRKMTNDEIAKAKAYLKDEGMLSDYWRFSDFQRSKLSM